MSCQNVTVTQLPLEGDIFRTEWAGDEKGEGLGTQVRYPDPEVVDDYKDKFLEGVQFPPIDVFFDGTNYWLADGWHRWKAACYAGMKTIDAIVHQGTKRDAILHAVGANRTHGLRRTNEDKREAVMMLLKDEEWVTWSNRQIADRVGVSHTFVANIRKELATVATPADAAAEDEVDPLKVHDPEPCEGEQEEAHEPELSEAEQKRRSKALGLAQDVYNRMSELDLMTREDSELRRLSYHTIANAIENFAPEILKTNAAA